MPSIVPPTTASTSFVSHLLPSLLSPSSNNSNPPSSSSSSSSTRSSKRSRRRSTSSSLLSTSTSSTTATSLAPSSSPPHHHHHQPPLGFGTSPIPPNALILSDGSGMRGGQHDTRIERKKPRKIGRVEGWWIWYQGTYVSSMLETWEFVLIHTLLLLLLILLSIALSYLPQHASLMADRVRYYVSG